jgi:hypothetical protein
MSTPDRRSFCECGHLTTHHGAAGPRLCPEARCPCEGLQRAPGPCCTNCGHPLSFRTRTFSDGREGCTAMGCTCSEWSTNDPAAGRDAPPRDVVLARLDGRHYRFEFRGPELGERVRLRVTPTGHVQVEIAGSLPTS